MNKFKELKETLMAVTEYIVSLNKEVEIVKKKKKKKKNPNGTFTYSMEWGGQHIFSQKL